MGIYLGEKALLPKTSGGSDNIKFIFTKDRPGIYYGAGSNGGAIRRQYGKILAGGKTSNYIFLAIINENTLECERVIQLRSGYLGNAYPGGSAFYNNPNDLSKVLYSYSSYGGDILIDLDTGETSTPASKDGYYNIKTWDRLLDDGKGYLTEQNGSLYMAYSKPYNYDEKKVLFNQTTGSIIRYIYREEIVLTTELGESITIQDKNVGASTYGSTGQYYCFGAKTSGSGHSDEEDRSTYQTPATDRFEIPSEDDWDRLLSIFEHIVGDTTNDSLNNYLGLPISGYALASNSRRVQMEGTYADYFSSAATSNGFILIRGKATGAEKINALSKVDGRQIRLFKKNSYVIAGTDFKSDT